MPRYVTDETSSTISPKTLRADIRSASDQTLDNQNDEELNSLHSKIRSLRSVRSLSPISTPLSLTLQVTIDILDDSRGQNDQLDRTTNTFSSFTNSLFSTRNHHNRSMASQSALRQYRMILYVVGALVVLWMLSKVFGGVGGGGGGYKTPVGDVEY